MHKLFTIISLFVLVVSSSALAGSPQTQLFPSKPGELIVKLKEDPSVSKSLLHFQSVASDLQKILKTKSSIRIRSLMTTSQYAVFKLADSEKISALEVLKNDPRVAYAEPNYIYHALGTSEVTPNDAQFSNLWGMKNSGQPEIGNTTKIGKAGADIHVTSVWAEGITGSKSIRVAVIDTGINYNHPDLKANVDAASGYNFVTNTSDALDDQNHGSHCAGTIGAVANNGVGVAGVNWNVTLIPVKFLDSSGSGSADGALQAVQYATKLGVNVMSNSWGGGGFSQALMDAITAAKNKGILFVAAAGNDGSDNDSRSTYPANYAVDNIISVAATDNQDVLASFSNYGRKSVHIAAPGVKILSTLADGNYGVMSGTSMATPHVAGMAALLWSTNPSLTFAEVKDKLIHSCDPVRSLSRKVACGGRANIYNAIHGISPAPNGPAEADWKDVILSIETPHPYENAKTYTYPISIPNAKYIRVIFDSIDTEKEYDYVHLKQADGQEIETYSGSAQNYISDYLTGDHAEVSLTTDSSKDGAGFSVTRVQAVY